MGMKSGGSGKERDGSRRRCHSSEIEVMALDEEVINVDEEVRAHELK